MTEQVINGLLVLAGVALTVVGGVVGTVIASRAQRRGGDIAAKAAAGAAKKSAEQQMIDQLQEELARFRAATDQRLEKLEVENRAYRQFLFVQRDHMLEHGVTPPPWPDTLPR
jgi:hypothetical protein